MTNKLFSFYKNEDYRYVLNLLGIKISIANKNLLIKNLEKRLKDTEYFTRSATRWNLFNWANEDKITEKEKIWFISQQFYEEVGYYPDLKNPKSFNEKINWIKLNYYNPTETRCIDKYEFKGYIKEKLGDGYTVPLLGVYNSVDEIDFNKLPDQFVLKTNNAGGGEYGILIVKDKKTLDIDKTKYIFNDWLQNWMNCYYYTLDFGYKNIKPKIISEQYIEQIDGQVYDYKFHCFHGEPKVVLAIKDRKPGKKYKFAFYDMNWSKLNVDRGNKDLVTDMKKPKNFDKMLEISKILSKDFPFVRVDFYEVDDKIYVGELTFAPKSGFGKFEPVDFDYQLGEYLDLSKIDKKYLKVKEL